MRFFDKVMVAFVISVVGLLAYGINQYNKTTRLYIQYGYKKAVVPKGFETLWVVPGVHIPEAQMGEPDGKQ